jgi:CHAT domain-containing protein
VLVTRPATDLSEANWWISAVTPVQIPSASALVLERGQHANHAGSPFIAFADPSFDGKAADPVQGASVSDVRARARAISGGSATAGFDYHQVAPLPETLDEARSIATALGAGDQSVISGTQASRSRVLKQDLSDYRVVLFATHGLTAGELPGMREAGLALAYEGSGLMDSVLTVDDIVPLRLNADWVVLSACNTGYTSGEAGDSISAMARGFFAAGGRSLLVTQWAVESRSATELTTGLFKAYGADQSLSKADAIAHVQRDMLSGKDGALYKHPYFWAPYFLSGDAAR